MRTSTPARVLAAIVAAAPAIALGATPPSPDLSTPRRAVRAFIDPARAGEFALAARALDLDAVPEARRPAEGPLLARELAFVLDQKLWIDWDKISDDPAGDPADGPRADVIGAIPLGAASVPVRLVRRTDGWRIGPGLVEAVPRLYAAYGPGWIGERLPPVLIEVRFLEVQAWQWIGLLAGLLVAWLVAGALGAAGRRVALRLARRTRVTWDDLLVEEASAPARLLLGIATFAAAVRALRLAVPAQDAVDQLLRIAAVVAFTWAALRAVRFGAGVLDARLSEIASGDEASARSRRTQLMVLKRIAGFVVLVVGGALVLLQFDALRAVGTSVLASAGVAGVAIGFAAQRSLAALLGGLQVSLTQPLRVGDVVVVEGEWGTVEEITLTYVVVKIWDLRRLVVPITKILDASFESWTRSGTALLGTVLVHADWRVPVEAVRAELARFVQERKEWDGAAVGLQVTDTTERTVELRALVSAADSSRIWDLRCAVREHLVGFLQRLDDGRYLPRTRLDGPALAPARNEAVRAPAVAAEPARRG